MSDFIRKYKAWIVGPILMTCIALFYSNQREEEKSARMIEAQKMRSISVLPVGVKETWLAYIQKRFSEEIQREGNSLRVRETYIGAPPTYSYVSLGHPYEVDCNNLYMGFSVFFPSGIGDDDGISANLTGDFSSDHKNEPELGAPVGSIASDNLDAVLCRYLASLMDNIVSRNSP